LIFSSLEVCCITEEQSELGWLQSGNNFPFLEIVTETSSELKDNGIGGVWHGFWAVGMHDIIETEILPIGLKRARIAINGFSHNVIKWDKPELIIEPIDDEVITRIASNNISITYVLNFWDKDWYSEGNQIPCPRFKNREEIERYLEFVRFIVHHFKDRVEYYEIWNEPDMGWDETNMEPCIQAIDVEDYINIAKEAITVIRDEYPDAKIVVGSTMPQVEPGSREYLLSLLNSDLMPLVDVIAWHPGGPAPDHTFWKEYYLNYKFLVQEIKDTAYENGFLGEFTADEMVWWTQEDFPTYEPWTYTKIVAAKYYARMIITHLGMGVTVKPGGISSNRKTSFNTIKRLCTILSGNMPTDFPVTIENQSVNMEKNCFTLPDGDKLLALWNDVQARDVCEGVRINLTLEGLAGKYVMGIDVLKGVQQLLVSENEDSDLVIKDLIVRDYPLILRIYSKRSSSITCSVDRVEVVEGETIKISGELIPGIANQTITLTYEDPNGSKENRTVTTNSSGIYNHSQISETAGSWTVTAGWNGDIYHEATKSSEKSFTVIGRPDEENGGGIPGFSYGSLLIGITVGMLFLWKTTCVKYKQPSSNFSNFFNRCFYPYLVMFIVYGRFIRYYWRQ
jgi:hypothetical protein